MLDLLAGNQTEQVLCEADGHEQSADGDERSEDPLRQLGAGSKLSLVVLVQGHKHTVVTDDGGKDGGKQHGDDAQCPAGFGPDPVSKDGQAKVCSPLGSNGSTQQAEQNEQIGGDLLGEGERGAEHIPGYHIDKGQCGHHDQAYAYQRLLNVVKNFIHLCSPY